MRMRVWSATMIFAAATMVAGCGGDNLDFCEGCGSPTPTVTVTPTPTPTESVATPTTPTATPTPPGL